MVSEPLGIRDKTFLINRLIQQAPTKTLVREFFKNAEENAVLAPFGARHVKIYPVVLDGVRKLAFWNTGVGLSDEELRVATDLSSSLNKAMGLDGNFGIGAKVSGLSASPHGIRYRSCKNGVVTQIIIGYDEEQETYVRFEYEQLKATTIDVTAAVHQEGIHKTDQDWTEVVLFGEAADHDTVAEPLGLGKRADRSYVPSEIFRRFARFADGVEVRADVALTKGGGVGETGRTRRVKTLEEVIQDAKLRHERVRDPASSVVVHYIHDPRNPATGHSQSASSNAAVSSNSFCALVHKGERYSYETGKGWTFAAPRFGIAFGSRVISVEIELPDSHATPNQYRTGLTRPDDRSDIELKEYAELVNGLMPEWVRAIDRECAPDTNEDLSDLKAVLQRLLEELRAPAETLKPTKSPEFQFADPSISGVSQATAAEDDGFSDSAKDTAKGGLGIARTGSRAGGSKLHQAPTGAVPSKSSLSLEQAPHITVINDPEEIDAKRLRGRAGRYYKETSEVFINGTYAVIGKMTDELIQELSAGADADVVQHAAHKSATHFCAYRVGKAVCYAIGKRRYSDDWTEEHLDMATSPESLTMAADDFRQSMKEAKRYAKDLIKLSSMEKASIATGYPDDE